MFELPEYVVLAGQMNQSISGKTVRQGSLGNSPHKFVWYNQTPQTFEALTRGKKVGTASSRGRWLFLNLEPGYVLVFGECGGRILFHRAGEKLPDKYHMLITFTDGTALSAMTQMWGAMELYKQGEEQNRTYIQGMKTTPIEEAFTFEYFRKLVQDSTQEGKRSVKGLLTQDQLIPGLGNSIAQDIMLIAKLHPKKDISALSADQEKTLYQAIVRTVKKVIDQGGRNDEYTLFGDRGAYKRLLDKDSPKNGCPICGGTVEKIQYLGGSSYYCANCQRL